MQAAKNNEFGPKPGEVGFDEVTTADGRTFYWLANIPHTRKDGSETELAVWHSKCKVCGGSFTVTTPLTTNSKAFGRKHCDEHKLTPEEARKHFHRHLGGDWGPQP